MRARARACAPTGAAGAAASALKATPPRPRLNSYSPVTDFFEIVLSAALRTQRYAKKEVGGVEKKRSASVQATARAAINGRCSVD